MLFIVACNLKTKTELYLERELDILDNVISINNGKLGDEILVRKIGVIRNRDKNTRDLILLLDSVPISERENQLIRIIAYKEILGTWHKSDTWDIKINPISNKKNQYIVHDLVSRIEIRADTLKMFLIDAEREMAISDTIQFNNLYLDND